MQDSKEAARRIADELAALSRQAKAARLDIVAYLIDMARIEADNAAGSAP